MEGKRHTSNRKCPDCGGTLFQNDPRSNIFGCDSEQCMTTWRLVNGRPTREIGKQKVLEQMFHRRMFERDDTHEVYEARGLNKILKAVKPWWKVW